MRYNLFPGIQKQSEALWEKRHDFQLFPCYSSSVLVLKDFVYFFSCHLAVSVIIDHHCWCQSTSADTSYGLQGVFQVISAFSWLYAKDLLHFPEYPNSPPDVAGCPPAYSDNVSSCGDKLELGIKRSHSKNPALGEVGKFGYLSHCRLR